MTAKAKKLLTTSCSVLLMFFVLLCSTITASASNGYLPFSIAVTNAYNLPYSYIATEVRQGGSSTWVEGFSTIVADDLLWTPTIDIALGSEVDYGSVIIGDNVMELSDTDIPTGKYNVIARTRIDVDSQPYLFSATYHNYQAFSYDESTTGEIISYSFFVFEDIENSTTLNVEDLADYDVDLAYAYILIPADDGTATCPTLEEQIADYDSSWYMFEQMLKANNYELWLKYSSELADFGSIQYSQGLTQGYQNGFMAALSGNNVEDPIDQYWNSTKEYVLIAGQPYFAPNGFGAIDAYNTIGIYGEHESKLHKQDGTTQVFNGQYVTEFASAGTLGGGWYKIGSTVGDEYAYEQSFNVSAMDKAYYVSRVSPLGDPVEEFLVAIWLDDYGAWYVAEEYVHYGTVANNDKSYKQVYGIYMTDTRPTSQRFINYDNPTLYENFDEDVNATLYLATFNQLNNYNVYTDDIGIVESYNNGFDAGANTTLWTDLIAQPIVAFFSIPLAQVIIEGVTYTLTYGLVLGAGIVGLIVIWFLKLFAGG